MAALGHVAVGLAIGRVAAQPHPTHRRPAIWMAAAWLAAIPDVDAYMGFLGVEHRGPTHSVGFLLLVVLVVVLAARVAGWATRPVALMATAAVGSHLLLDMLGAGSPMPLLWPITSTPFHPVGMLVAPAWTTEFRFEVLWSAPFLIYALWPLLGRLTRDRGGAAASHGPGPAGE